MATNTCDNSMIATSRRDESLISISIQRSIFKPVFPTLLLLFFVETNALFICTSKMKIISINSIVILSLLKLAHSTQEFEINRSPVELVGPDGTVVRVSQIPSSLVNVTFEGIEFDNANLFTAALHPHFDNGNEAIFVGARESVHRVEFSPKSKGRRMFVKQSSDKLPLQINEECPAATSSSLNLKSNDIKTLFIDSENVYGCGTSNCGLCEAFSLDDLTNHSHVGSKSSVANFVGSFGSSITFPGIYKNKNVFFVAMEPEVLSSNMTSPFFSARSIDGEGSVNNTYQL